MSWSPGVGTTTPGSTPKHSVHFHDPQLLKDGVLVTKVFSPQKNMLFVVSITLLIKLGAVSNSVRQRYPGQAEESGRIKLISNVTDTDFLLQVRLVQLSPSSSPLHLSSSSSPSTNGSSPHINYSPSKNLPSLSKNTSSEATCSPSPPIRCSPSRMKSCPLNPSPSPSSSPHHTVSRASLTTRTH